MTQKDQQLLMAFGLGWILSRSMKAQPGFTQGQLVNPFKSKADLVAYKSAKVKPFVLPGVETEIPRIRPAATMPAVQIRPGTKVMPRIQAPVKLQPQIQTRAKQIQTLKECYGY